MMSLATGKPSAPDAEMQLFYLAKRWGLDSLGPHLGLVDLLRINKLDHVDRVFSMFANPKNWKTMSQTDLKLARRALTDDRT